MRRHIHDPGRIASADDLNRRHFRALPDVSEVARRDQRAQNRCIEEDVLIVLLENVRNIDVVVPELPKNKPVGQIVNRCRTPSHDGDHRLELSRHRSIDRRCVLLHFVVAIAEVSPRLFGR